MSWQKQTITKPLFPDILWNQPINKRSSGSLLVVGGHATQFSYTQSVYTETIAAGIGSVGVALPRSVYKLVGSLPDCNFLPETPSGSLAANALDELLELAAAVDAVVLAGELSNNTETVQLLGRFMEDCQPPIIVDDEVVEMFHKTPDTLPSEGLYITTVATACSLARSYKIPIDIKTPNPQKTNQLLSQLSDVLAANLAIYDGEHIFVQSEGKQSMTPQNGAGSASITAYMSTFFLQHNDKYEALTTAAYRAAGGSTDI